MADRSTSLTLPQNRPNDAESTQLNSSPLRPAPVLIEGGDGANKVNAAQTENRPSNSMKRSESPTKDSCNSQSTKKSSRSRYNYIHDDEKHVNWLITKARKAARDDGSPFTDKDVPDLANLVAEMSYLLASAGYGREKTNRAIAYIRGPDKVKANKALGQVRRDWRHGKRTSGSSSKSKNLSANEDAKSTISNKDGDSVSREDHNQSSFVGNTSSEPGKDALEVGDVAPNVGDNVAAIATETVKEVVVDASAKKVEGDGAYKVKKQIYKYKGKKGTPFFNGNWSFRGKNRNRNKKSDEGETKHVPQDAHPGKADSVITDNTGIESEVGSLCLSPNSLPTVTAAPVA